MWKVLGREYVGCAHFHYEILLDFVWWEKAPEVVVESLSEEGNGEYGTFKFSVKAPATELSTECYFIAVLFMWALSHSKIS